MASVFTTAPLEIASGTPGTESRVYSLDGGGAHLILDVGSGDGSFFHCNPTIPVFPRRYGLANTSAIIHFYARVGYEVTCDTSQVKIDWGASLGGTYWPAAGNPPSGLTSDLYGTPLWAHPLDLVATGASSLTDQFFAIADDTKSWSWDTPEILGALADNLFGSSFDIYQGTVAPMIGTASAGFLREPTLTLKAGASIPQQVTVTRSTQLLSGYMDFTMLLKLLTGIKQLGGSNPWNHVADFGSYHRASTLIGTIKYQNTEIFGQPFATSVPDSATDCGEARMLHSSSGRMKLIYSREAVGTLTATSDDNGNTWTPDNYPTASPANLAIAGCYHPAIAMKDDSLLYAAFFPFFLTPTKGVIVAYYQAAGDSARSDAFNFVDANGDPIIIKDDSFDIISYGSNDDNANRWLFTARADSDGAVHLWQSAEDKPAAWEEIAIPSMSGAYHPILVSNRGDLLLCGLVPVDETTGTITGVFRAAGAEFDTPFTFKDDTGSPLVVYDDTFHIVPLNEGADRWVLTAMHLDGTQQDWFSAEVEPKTWTLKT